MPFGYGGGPWWLYSNQDYGNYPSSYRGRCARFPWSPRWWWANSQQDYAGAYSGFPGLTNPVAPTAPAAPTKDQELEVFKNDAKMLKEELSAIEKRIQELEKKEE